MQIVLLFSAFFTALAFAEHHHVPHPQRFHHRRALNATSHDAEPSTTLTISVTSVRTVLGCPTTQTDCPLATHPISIVTDIVALYTTVCPLTDARSISASFISSAATRGVLGSLTSPTVAIPLSTGVTAAQAAVSGAESSSKADTTLTYVLGTGTSKITITTTIKHYKTETDYVTKYVTKPSSSATVSGAALLIGQEAAVTFAATSASGTPSAGNLMEPTTTITTTSTTTKTITVHSQIPSPTAGGNTSGYSAQNSATLVKAFTTVNSNAAVPSTHAVGECPPQITVTIALSTVTVTYSAMGIANTAAHLIGSVKPISTGTPQVVSVTPLPTSSLVGNDPVATHPIVSYHGGPYGNGTVTMKANPSCGSSGFLTQSRVMPTGKPYGTGSYHIHGTGYAPSVTSKFPTEVATPTAYY